MRRYNQNEKCTIQVASDLICMSEETAKRRLRRLRMAKGYAKYHPITVAEFAEFYHIIL